MQYTYEHVKITNTESRFSISIKIYSVKVQSLIVILQISSILDVFLYFQMEDLTLKNGRIYKPIIIYLFLMLFSLEINSLLLILILLKTVTHARI